MEKIGFEFTYLASAKPKVSFFGNKDTSVADNSNDDSTRPVVKSSVAKDVGNTELWDMLTEGKLFDKFDSK